MVGFEVFLYTVTLLHRRVTMEEQDNGGLISNAADE